MRYIANILTNSKSYAFNDFIHVCKEENDIIKGIPTLVVGVNNAKEVFSGYNLNYIERKIDENTFWTFNVTEKRSENERDVEEFKQYIVKVLKDKIEYSFFNILTCSRKKFKNFLIFLKNNKEKFYFFTTKMLYIAYDDTVIGISLDDCEYLGVEKKKVYNKILNFSKNVITENKFLTMEEKLFFNNDNILMAALFCYANS